MTKTKTKTKTQSVRAPRRDAMPKPERRRKQAPQSEEGTAAHVRPLLVSRRDAAQMLGRVDVGTIKRLEQMNVLRPLRLNPRSPTAQVFFNVDDVIALARGYVNPQNTAKASR
jgi:hypothetical protein